MAREEKRNAVEWSVFGLGTLLTVTVMLFLAYEALSGNGAADLRPTVGAPRAEPAGVAVPVTLENAGDATALDINVEVCDAGGTCRSIAIPQMSGGSTREGTAVFPPGAAGFTARVLSYQAE